MQERPGGGTEAWLLCHSSMAVTAQGFSGPPRPPVFFLLDFDGVPRSHRLAPGAWPAAGIGPDCAGPQDLGLGVLQWLRVWSELPGMFVKRTDEKNGCWKASPSLARAWWLRTSRAACTLSSTKPRTVGPRLLSRSLPPAQAFRLGPPTGCTRAASGPASCRRCSSVSRSACFSGFQGMTPSGTRLRGYVVWTPGAARGPRALSADRVDDSRENIGGSECRGSSVLKCCSRWRHRPHSPAQGHSPPPTSASPPTGTESS